MLEHHMPHDGIVLKPIHRYVFAIAGQFLTAMWHFADQHEMRIHLMQRLAPAKKWNTSAIAGISSFSAAL